MKQKGFKNTNGITLIALVVTIVVLLILAGISLNLVLGQNGLITKAKDAKTQTEQDQLNIEIAMNNLADEIDAILGNGGTGGSGNEGGEEGGGSDDTVDLSSLAIGDYVNYTYDTVADGYSLLRTQSGYDSDQTVAQSSTTLKWRVLNIDEDTGKIDLVSSEPSDNTVYFQGALGYNNGVYLLNDMCAELYSNSALGITARSINLEDTEKHLTETGLAARNAYTNGYDEQYGSVLTYTGSNAYYPDLYSQESGSGINTTTVKTDGIGQSYAYYTTPTTKTYSQASDSGLTVTQTYYDIAINSTNYGAGADVLYSNNSYWIASRCIRCYSDNAYFDLCYAGISMLGNLLFKSGSTEWDIYYRLRPVVSLDSSLLDGTKDADGAWNLK